MVKKIVILSIVFIISGIVLFFSIRGLAGYKDRSSEFNQRFEEHRTKLDGLGRGFTELNKQIGNIKQETGSIRTEYTGIPKQLERITKAIGADRERIRAVIIGLETIPARIENIENSLGK